MKLISTLIFVIVFCLSASSQQWKLTSGYSLAIPRQEMGQNIQPAHSVEPGILYQLPGKLKNLFIGAEAGLGLYASKRIDQTFQFDNNTSSIVPVNYNSNVVNANFMARLKLLTIRNFISPYINAKGGLYVFYSNIFVDDPRDANGCHAIEQKTILNDRTLYWSAGGGLLINAFSKEKKRSKVMIDASANTIHGGPVSYINTKRLIDAQTMNDPGGKPLNVQFINASTQSIHEHTVAQVYTTPLRMLEFRLGITMTLGED